MIKPILTFVFKSAIIVSSVCSPIESAVAFEKKKFEVPAAPFLVHATTKRYIDELEKLDLQGAVLVAQGDRVIYHKAGGVAFGGSEEQVEPDSQFLIASVSKQFTAAALLKALSDENPSPDAVKAALHRPLSTYLPSDHEIWAGKTPKWANQVTLHHLLTHTSGVRNFTSEDKFRSHFFWHRHSNAEVMSLVKKKLKFRPGSRESYSNTNFLLLSEVVATLSNQPFDQYLDENFFQPLGMDATHQPTQGLAKRLQRDERFPKLIDSLDDDLTELGYYIDLSNVQGCGAIISTLEDLHKWNVALHMDYRVLPEDIYTMMVTNYTSHLVWGNTGMGYGIEVEECSHRAVYSHRGNLDSFNSILLFSPESKTTVAGFCNTDRDYGSLMDAVERML